MSEIFDAALRISTIDNNAIARFLMLYRKAIRRSPFEFRLILHST